MKINFTRGFTLIELLVVIAIIGLLSSVVLASLNGARIKARDAQRMEDIHQIDTAIQLYISSTGHAPYLVGLTGDDCSASNPANVRSMNLSGTGGNGPCQASSIESTSWNVLATELEPYIKKLPVDPRNTHADGGSNLNLYYVYAAPANMSQNCDPVIDDGSYSPNRCVQIFGNNSVYGLYAGRESLGGLGFGDPTTYIFSRSSPKSFTGNIGSRF